MYLDLSYNNLTMLADNTFSTLNRLTFLDLSGNDFVTLSEKLFDNVLPSMAHLKLSDTGITSLRDFYLPTLVTFNVSHNKCVLSFDFFHCLRAVFFEFGTFHRISVEFHFDLIGQYREHSVGFHEPLRQPS